MSKPFIFGYDQDSSFQTVVFYIARTVHRVYRHWTDVYFNERLTYEELRNNESRTGTVFPFAKHERYLFEIPSNTGLPSVHSSESKENLPTSIKPSHHPSSNGIGSTYTIYILAYPRTTPQGVDGLFLYQSTFDRIVLLIFLTRFHLLL